MRFISAIHHPEPFLHAGQSKAAFPFDTLKMKHLAGIVDHQHAR
jgi:hypothetical protein